MSATPWLLGGGALAAYLVVRSRDNAPEPGAPASPPAPPPSPSQPTKPATTAPPASTSSAPGVPPKIQVALPGRWVFPVARWGERRPVISSGVGSPRPGGPHRGVDIMFPRHPDDAFPPGTPNGSTRHVMPDNVVAVAAGDGVVWSAGPTPRGFAVVIDHSPVKLATFYTHLEKLFVTPTSRAAAQQRVKAGQPIGIVGFDPLDASHLKHLHLETWLGGDKDAIDPQPLLAQWPTIADPRIATAATRNARRKDRADLVAVTSHYRAWPGTALPRAR